MKARKKNINVRHQKTGGEQSPYWDWLSRTASSHGNGNGGNAEMREPVEANPDILPESAAMYHTELSDEAAFRLEVVQEAVETLSEQQRRIIHLVGTKGQSLQEAANSLSISKSTAQKLLERARTKIEKLYVIRKAQLGSIG